ncbi:MAG: virulence RhuM family protein [Victivallales bacterium]|nr:virulence RhuM family protein [Victivallales bacterium]
MPEPQNEIIIYQPDATIRLEVRLENDTVWLTQSQMAQLFGCTIKNVSVHLRNIYQCNELQEDATMKEIFIVRFEGQREVSRTVSCYNLDAIISVGYRVNSILGVKFRQWATGVLKDYLLRGYAVNDRLDRLENRMTKAEEQIGVFVKTALPPVEGVLFEGQICDAYATALKIIRSARSSLVLIDNYIDESVLTMLGDRNPDVSATIYTRHFSRKLRLDLQRYNAQYPPVVIKAYQGAHDRFLILDDATVYHVGASLKDLGKSLFAFSRMELPAREILDRLPK